MSIKTVIASRVTQYLTSEKRQERKRATAERKRRKSGQPHTIEYFHQTDDPYSHLAAQALQKLVRRYDVVVKGYLVGPPADWAAPERARLKAYGRRDAHQVSRYAGVDFNDPGRDPSPETVSNAAGIIAEHQQSDQFLSAAIAAGHELWGDATTSTKTTNADKAISQGQARRKTLGHFMSAMIQYGGEWYWGIDRLHYLESRLRSLGAQKPGAPTDFIFDPPAVPLPAAAPPPAKQAKLEYFLSFRSPYTYIAADRANRLAQKYGAELQLRFVLPMVMRGLPVPRMKGLYFMLDTAREARSAGVPFGRIADPIGSPVERGYSLLPWARSEGRGLDFCRSFMQAVWAEGTDAASDSGLKKIVERAGLKWTTARTLIGNDDWRAEAETNRQQLLDLGLWGVPCFGAGSTTVWGQDRLWLVEEALIQQTTNA